MFSIGNTGAGLSLLLLQQQFSSSWCPGSTSKSQMNKYKNIYDIYPSLFIPNHTNALIKMPFVLFVCITVILTDNKNNSNCWCLMNICSHKQRIVAVSLSIWVLFTVDLLLIPHLLLKLICFHRFPLSPTHKGYCNRWCWTKSVTHLLMFVLIRIAVSFHQFSPRVTCLSEYEMRIVRGLSWWLLPKKNLYPWSLLR